MYLVIVCVSMGMQKAGLSGFGPESSSEPNPICEPAPKAMAIEGRLLVSFEWVIE